MHTEALDHLNLRGDLQRALARGRVPPAVPADDPARRRRADRGGGADPLAQPDPRVRLAGRLHPDRRGVGLIVDIGQWVLETAAARWPAGGATSPISGSTSTSPGTSWCTRAFADNVMRALAIAGLPSSAVTLS